VTGAVKKACALAGILAACAPPCWSGEAEKGRQIAAIFQQAQPHLHRIYQPGPQAPCEELLRALSQGSPEAEFIEPSVRTDDFDHPELARYRRCEKEGAGMLHSAQHGFRLYRLEMDGDESNGPEEYLYSEWKAYADWKERGGEAARRHGEGPYYAGYRSIDLERCSTRDGISVAPQSWAPGTAFNAIVRFRSTFHSLNMSVIPGSKPDYYLRIGTYEPHKRAFSPSDSCLARSFRQKPVIFVPHF
jgi:hypothetical protein